MEPFRVVIDTNVLISGLCFGGIPAQVIRQALIGKIELFTSPFLVDEFKRVMEMKFPHKELEILATLNELSLLWQIVPPEVGPKISAIINDPSDNKVLECAVAARAHGIVSGDKHLLCLKKFRAIPILPPTEFLRYFKL